MPIELFKANCRLIQSGQLSPNRASSENIDKFAQITAIPMTTL